jgi:cation:H+ antiporter
MRIPRVAYLAIIIGVILILVHIESSLLSVFSMVVGLVIIALTGEPMVEGLNAFGNYRGLSDHVTGIISSLASNLPEMVMTLFMILSPHLREVAILTVMLASSFNGLLLGLLIIMLTYRGGSIPISDRILRYDVEIMRVTIACCIIMFGTGLILQTQGKGHTILPREIAVFLLIPYLGYLFFVSKGGNGWDEHGNQNHGDAGSSKGWLVPIVVGLVGIIVSAELISGSSEMLVHSLDLHVVIAATVIGFAASVPEHGIALIGARRGHVELGVSNLLSGIVQSIMLIFPILAVIVPVPLDGYVIYQFLAIAVTLWIVKKSIVDDHSLTLDEGVSIILIHVLGILLFDELSILI